MCSWDIWKRPSIVDSVTFCDRSIRYNIASRANYCLWVPLNNIIRMKNQFWPSDLHHIPHSWLAFSTATATSSCLHNCSMAPTCSAAAVTWSFATNVTFSTAASVILRASAAATWNCDTTVTLCAVTWNCTTPVTWNSAVVILSDPAAVTWRCAAFFVSNTGSNSLSKGKTYFC